MQHPKEKKKKFKVEFLVFIFIQKLEKGELIVHSANICSSFGYIFYQAVTRVLMWQHGTATFTCSLAQI